MNDHNNMTMDMTMMNKNNHQAIRAAQASITKHD